MSTGASIRSADGNHGCAIRFAHLRSFASTPPKAVLKEQQINSEHLPERHLQAIKRQARAQITGQRNVESADWWARWQF